MSRFGGIIGVCTNRGEAQLQSIASIRQYSDPSTQIVVIFNGVSPFELPEGVDFAHYPERLGKEQGVWKVAYDLAVMLGWDWCGSFHDDFYMKEPGWEAWIADQQKVYRSGLATFAGLSSLTPTNTSDPNMDPKYTMQTGNVAPYEETDPLCIAIDGCGMAFNMNLFRRRGFFTTVVAECGYGEIEAALWALTQSWGVLRIPFQSDHHPSGVPNTRDVLGTMTAGQHESVEPYIDRLPAKVISNSEIDLNGKIVDLRWKGSCSIEGSFVRLRPISRDDLEYVRVLRNVSAYAFFDQRPITVDQQTAWYERVYLPNANDHYFVVSVQRQRVGAIALQHIDWDKKTATVGRVMIDAAYRGRGYARDALEAICAYAFNDLGMQSVDLVVKSDNLPAIRLYESCTFNLTKREAGSLQYIRNKSMIPVLRPTYGPEEIEAAVRVLKSSWSGSGPEVAAFEFEFEKFLSSSSYENQKRLYVTATNSCTSALHLALYALSTDARRPIGKTEEIITTPITFVSTAHAISYVAKPIFADVLNDGSCNIDPESIERLCRERSPRAIVVVHLGGVACDMDRIWGISAKYDIPVIEDCAHAAGSRYANGKIVGSDPRSAFACFSFHAVKNLSMGDGGAVVCHDSDVASRLKKLRWCGIDRSTFDRMRQVTYSWQYDVPEIGFKYQMHEVAAAIGRVQMQKLQANNGRRRDIARRYIEGLREVSWIELPTCDVDLSAWHLFAIRVETEEIRDSLMKYLSDRGIQTSVHYYPVNMFGPYQEAYSETPSARSEWRRRLSIPMHVSLTSADVQAVINSILSFKET